MNVRVLPVDAPGAAAEAADVLRAGGLVVLPTDTVYGVSAAIDEAAIDRIFAAKQRPPERAVPVLLADPGSAHLVTREFSAEAQRLAEAFWPGPLTIVVPRREGLPPNLTQLPTVGVRVPDHAGARAVIAAAGGARVTGWVRSDAAAAPLAACGIPVIAGETVAAARAAGPFDAIIDMAGGETLAIAAGMLAAGGRCVVVGNASGAPTVIDAAELYMNRRELCGFALFPELETKPAAEGLPRLFALWEKGAVTVPDISPVDAMAFSDPAGLPPGKCVLVFD